MRLVLFTGLRLGELLGLRWEDVDFRAGMLNVSRTLNRLNKIHPVSGEAATEIVLQTPKSDNSVRSIPLLQQVLRDLQNWRGVQQSDKSSNPNYADSGMIVTNPLGRHIEPRTFKDTRNCRIKAFHVPRAQAHVRIQSDGARDGREDAFGDTRALFGSFHDGHVHSCA